MLRWSIIFTTSKNDMAVLWDKPFHHIALIKHHLAGLTDTTYFVRSRTDRNIILLTKTTAAQNEFALSYHRVRMGLYFLAATIHALGPTVVFCESTIILGETVAGNYVT